MSAPAWTDAAVSHPGLRIGTFVQSATNRLGVGKLAEIAGADAVVEYFHSTANSTRELVPLRSLSAVKLPPQTRCYFLENGRWQVGRIGRRCEDEYEVDVRRDRACFKREDDLRVRTSQVIEDPTEILAVKAHESARYHPLRTQFLEGIFAQRAASRGMTGAISARIALLPHQLKVIRRVIEDSVQRYLLADEVGLGKTIEAGCILRQFLLDNPGETVLLAVPSLLRDQWEQELDEKFDFNSLDGEVRIVSHEQLAAMAASQSFGMMIVDEAQHPAAWAFSEDESQQAAFGRLEALARNSPRLLLLSATPVLHNERQFLAMLHLLSPEVYELADVEKLRLRVASRQEIGRVLVGLHPDRPAFMWKGQLRALRELLPSDEVLQKQLQDLEVLLQTDVAEERRKALVREIRSHISEAYRLHRRMFRNRRATVRDVQVARGEGGAGATLKEEWDSDERAIPIMDAIERWRLAARDQVDSAQSDASLRSIFLILLEAASSDLDLLAAVTLCRLERKTRNAVENAFREADRLWVEPLFPGERELLNELASLAQQRTPYDRIDDVIQIIRNLRHREPGKKYVVFAGFNSAADRIWRRLKRFPDFAGARAYHAALEPDEVEEVFAEFREPRSQCDVLVCGQSGEEGRNLQHADYLIHFDLPWNPNRLEQRIGRLDRIGRTKPLRSHVFVGPDIEGGLSEAWYRVLREGFGLFSNSIASLQMFVETIMPEIRQIIWSRGAPGLVEFIPQLNERMETERKEVAEQDVLDEIEMLEEDANPWIQELLEFDAKDSEIQRAADAWIVGALHFERATAKSSPGIFSYRPSATRTQAPLEMIFGECVSALGEPVTYNRAAALEAPRSQLLRTGAVFLDRMTDYVRWDDRGQVFAFWRRVPDWQAEQAWAGFAFTFIIEPDLCSAAEAARSIYGTAETEALRRRAEAWLPPVLKDVFVDIHGQPVQSPDLLSRLTPNYRKKSHGGSDQNLTQFRIAAIDEFVDAASWPTVCRSARDSALRLLRSEPEFLARLRSAQVRAREDWLRRVNTLKVRAEIALGDEETQLLNRLDLDMESQVGDAALKGIATPRISVDSAGFIVLAGRDCPVAVES